MKYPQEELAYLAQLNKRRMKIILWQTDSPHGHSAESKLGSSDIYPVSKI